MQLFTDTAGQPDLRERVSQLLDFATQSIEKSNLGNKALYEIVPVAPPGRAKAADNKELNKKFKSSEKEIADLKKKVESLT